jgi:hypothetical protein
MVVCRRQIPSKGGKMNKTMNSASALAMFAERIDFTKLEGKPEDFYQAGLTFVESGQFDDGILEFVKIIKMVPHRAPLFIDAVKELKRMGFTSTDISAITGDHEYVEGIKAVLVSAAASPVNEKNTSHLFVGAITLLLFAAGLCSGAVGLVGMGTGDEGGRQASIPYVWLSVIGLGLSIFLILNYNRKKG